MGVFDCIDTGFFVSLLSIIMIDLVLAGDNSIVIAMAVQSLPREKRFKGILLGAFAAVLLRVIFTFFASQLMWSMEIMPFARVKTDFREDVVNLFAFAGLGLVLINRDISVDLIVDGVPVKNKEDSGTNTHFGFSLGAGTTVGRGKPFMLRTYPSWTYTVRDGTPRQYLSYNVNLALCFGSR